MCNPPWIFWHFILLYSQISLTPLQIRGKYISPNMNTGRKIICNWISTNIQRKTTLNHNLKMTHSNIWLYTLSTIQRIFLDNEYRLYEISLLKLIFHQVWTVEVTDKTVRKRSLILERIFDKCKCLIGIKHKHFIVLAETST